MLACYLTPVFDFFNLQMAAAQGYNIVGPNDGRKMSDIREQRSLFTSCF
jgi:hypothetical protein